MSISPSPEANQDTHQDSSTPTPSEPTLKVQQATPEILLNSQVAVALSEFQHIKIHDNPNAFQQFQDLEIKYIDILDIEDPENAALAELQRFKDNLDKQITNISVTESSHGEHHDEIQEAENDDEEEDDISDPLDVKEQILTLTNQLAAAQNQIAELRAVNHRLHNAGQVTSDQAFPHLGDTKHTYSHDSDRFCDDVLEDLEDLSVKNSTQLSSSFIYLCKFYIDELYEDLLSKFSKSLVVPDPMTIPECTDFFFTHFRKYRKSILSEKVCHEITQTIFKKLATETDQGNKFGPFQFSDSVKTRITKEIHRLLHLFFEIRLQVSNVHVEYPESFDPLNPVVEYNSSLHAGAYDPITQDNGTLVFLIVPPLYVGDELSIKGRVDTFEE